MKTIIKLSIVILMVFSTTLVFSQALITDQEEVSPAGPDASALLELRSDGGTQGLLIPRVLMIKSGNYPVPASESFSLSPADGLLIYNPGGGGEDAVDKGLWYYDATHDNGDGTTGRWFIYSNQGSIFSNSVNNYAEYFERSDDPSGYSSYSLTNGVWTTWTNNVYDPDVMGEYFSPYPDNLLTPGTLEVQESGIYQITMTGAFYRISNLTLEVSLFRTNGDGTDAIDKIYGMAKLASNGDTRGVAASGMVKLTQGDVLEVKFRSDATGEIGLVNFNLTVYKVGD